MIKFKMMKQDIKMYIFKSAILFFSLSVIVFSCSKDDDPATGDSRKIITDKEIFVQKEVIDASGGSIILNDANSLLDGMEILVPEGSYDEAITVNISYAEIKSHEFGELFNPVSPLIKIENGGKMSNQMMRLKIPISANPETYRMAFYYDRQTGELEGISTVRNETDFITIAVRHFSLIVVTEVQKELLIQGGGFHTGFDPSKNGWGFVNYGTYPEYEGICAGMSIGAAYYYKNFKAGLALNGFFDNDQLWFPTPDVWEDDASGIRYATAIHRVQKAFWDQNIGSIDTMIHAPDEDRFYNLIYSILVLNQPQLIYVDDPSASHAHMIIGFGYEINGNEAKINVYDPNFPNQESAISFDLLTKTFSKYTSAQNARALENNQLFHYSNIAFVPLTAVMSKDEMDFLWQRVQNKTIHEGLFPAYKIFAVPKDPGFSKVELHTSNNTLQNYIPFKDFDFVIEGLAPSFGLKLEALSFLPGFGLERYNPAQSIVMENRDTLIGLYLKATPANQTYDQWVGFEWFKIQLQNIWIEPVDTTVAVNAEINFVARHNNTAPKNALYKWDFGDGHQEESTDSIIVYKYEAPDEYEIQLTVIDRITNKEVSKVKTKVNVTIWPKIAITLKGMEATPPSTIKANDGADIPSIAWSNKVSSTAPGLKWNKNYFEVDFSFNIGEPVYTCRISGTMSNDFKKIIDCSAIFTGIGFGGDWTYISAISIFDFPIEEYIPGQIIGKSLRGPLAQAKVGNLSWKQTSKDAQGKITEITLQSVDWSSDQTELSIFFYNK
ncbi:MAG: PKD domain-containing protein [Saprospiraceae bacterium]|nr:PKD domain-containing protein [Saprospiraceae bacterium]